MIFPIFLEFFRDSKKLQNVENKNRSSNDYGLTDFQPIYTRVNVNGVGREDCQRNWFGTMTPV